MSIGFQHPNVKVHIGDGFKFLEQFENEFDVIITDSSAPEGPAESLFQKPYFELLNKALRDGGVITTQGCSLPFILPSQPVLRDHTMRHNPVLYNLIDVCSGKKGNSLILLTVSFLLSQPRTNGSISPSLPTSARSAVRSSPSPNTPTPPFRPIRPARSVSWSAARIPTVTCASPSVAGPKKRRRSSAAITTPRCTARALSCPTLRVRRWVISSLLSSPLLLLRIHICMMGLLLLLLLLLSLSMMIKRMDMCSMYRSGCWCYYMNTLIYGVKNSFH